MNKEIGFFNFSINKILSKDQSILDQARIRFLYYGFWIAAIAAGGFFINIYFQDRALLTITAGILFACIVFLFKYFTYRPQWRQISHSLLILATLINLNNVFIAFQKADIITLQVILLVILFSFYMLGKGWGLFYSLLNLIPVLVFLVLSYNAIYFISVPPATISQSTVIISIFGNFIIIIYINSHFYTAYFNNIKELKEISEKRQLLNNELELAIDKAEKSAQIKSEFLATMSHEIRTPLNAVIGMSNIMLMGNPRLDQVENLNVLKSSANNLLAIVNDVLDFNKITSGNVVFESIKFNMVDLLETICEAEILKAEKKGLSFMINIDPSLKNKLLIGDPVRIGQILYNLINNAIKFTIEGNIVVAVEHKNTNTVTFIVKDTGIGIEKSNLDSIFEPFTQQSITSTRQYGGTGMGLAIVKRLLELQGSQMYVSSKVGEGSVFSFSLELPVSPGKSEEPNKQEMNKLGKLRMLIAEDNPINVLLMKKLFARWDIIPSIAENGERAIEMVQYGNYDIILMDLQMPVMDGFDAAIEIRKQPDSKKATIPIIALTAAALYDIKERVLKAGMNDYVSKPFKPEELMGKIQSLVAAIH